MKKIIYITFLIVTFFFIITPSEADVCKVECETEERVVCLERGPCEPINEFLLKAVRECRKADPSRFLPITKLLFVDIFTRFIRLDKEFPQNIDRLKDSERYDLEAKLLAEKDIKIFVGTDPFDSLVHLVRLCV